MRTRDKSGGYNYTKGSVANLMEKEDELPANQKIEMERKQRMQEKIAEFRLIRFQKESDKI